MASCREKSDALQHELERMETMDAAELRRLWQSRRGSAPPPSATARLMRSALAWDLQAEAVGGETAATRRRWARIERARSEGASPMQAVDGIACAAAPAEGMRLIKTWRGRTHDVLVRADGVEWRGRRYRSLSAVARAITGTSRNGPAFFGLRSGEGGG